MIVECPGCERRYDVTGRPPGTKARCRCNTVFVLPEPTQRAGTLSCPNCGGSVGVGSRHCQYCSAELLLKACPRCFARIFHGSRHCNECGAKVEVPANASPDGSVSPLSCPRCEASPALVARLVGDVLMDECPECHGVWLDCAAVDRLVSERRRVSTQAVLGMGTTARPVQANGQPKGRVYVKCPECDVVMNRTNFARRSGIIIDTCRNHGTWFDADELPRVVDFVMDGGIEAAQKADRERAEAEVRRLKSQARMTRSQVSLESNESRTVSSFGDLLDVIGSLLSL